jgi:bis(5'-nucleosidyl)-tetraphosphatase
MAEKKVKKNKKNKSSKLGKLRIAAGVICYRLSDATILILRHSPGGHWGIPKGHKDPEDPDNLTCALRELEEEAGLKDLLIDEGFSEELHYTVPPTKKRKAHPKVVYHFLGIWPEEVEPVLSHEHDAYHFLKEVEFDEYIAFENMKPLLLQAFEYCRGK